MCKKMCHRITATVAIVVALALAITVSVEHQHHQGLAYIIFVTRFFDVMLPVLGVGALIKYLLSGNCCCNKEQESCCNKQ